MTGLSLGLAASILLTVFIQFELSFDRHFTHADRIYRLNSIWIDKGEAMEMPINLRRPSLKFLKRWLELNIQYRYTGVSIMR